MASKKGVGEGGVHVRVGEGGLTGCEDAFTHLV